MIHASNKYQRTSFLSVSLLTFILSACGGGGSETSGPLADNKSAPLASSSISPSSTPQAINSSLPSQTASSQSSTPSAASSLQTNGSEPAKPTLSSAAPSSYARSSRANNPSNDPSTDLGIYDPPPLEEEGDDYIDLPPSAPKSLQLELIATNGAVISWSTSTDDIGLSAYEVRRDGIAIGTSRATQRSFEDTGLKSNTYYTYTVRAIDIAGNRSNFSDQLVVKTISPTSTNSSTQASASAQASSESSFSSIDNQTQSSASISSVNQMSASSTVSSTSSDVASSAMPNSSSESSHSAPPNTSSKNSSSASSKTNARVEWITPSSRENGDYLELDEIGGYEIRYKPKNSSFYVQEIITDRYATHYERNDITVDTAFQIAVFDTNGLYSRFIQLTPQ